MACSMSEKSLPPKIPTLSSVPPIFCHVYLSPLDPDTGLGWSVACKEPGKPSILSRYLRSPGVKLKVSYWDFGGDQLSPHYKQGMLRFAEHQFYQQHFGVAPDRTVLEKAAHEEIPERLKCKRVNHPDGDDTWHIVLPRQGIMQRTRKQQADKSRWNEFLTNHGKRKRSEM